MTMKRRYPWVQRVLRGPFWQMFWCGTYLVFIQGTEVCWQYHPYADDEGPWWELRLWPPRIRREKL